jgi:hypothetical protein
MDNWNKLASSFLKAEIKKRNLTYEDVCTLLNQIGVDEKPGSLRTKLYRGGFSFAFVLQIVSVLNIQTLHFDNFFIDDLKKTASSSKEK